MKTLFLSIILVGLNSLLFSPVFAHEESHHKTPKMVGTLISLENDKAMIETNSGVVSFTISSQTKYEVGAKGTPADKSKLKPGLFLSIVGSKLASGEFAASLILIREEK